MGTPWSHAAWIREVLLYFEPKVDRGMMDYMYIVLYVASVKCAMCIRYQDCSRYNPAFTTGSTNLRKSSFKDHVRSDRCQRAMLLFKKRQYSNTTEYAPIAKANSLNTSSEQSLKKKFVITYLFCKQSLAFTKMAPICEPEKKHGVNLGCGV